MQAMGDHYGAKAAYENALKIDEAVFGPNHHNVAISCKNLGSVFQCVGDYSNSIEAYTRAIKILKNRLPEGHPSIKGVEKNLREVEELRQSSLRNDKTNSQEPVG